jgi:hypothetical protein
MKTTWKAVLGVILIFVLGCVFGAIGTSLIVRHRVLQIVRGGPEAMAELLERRTTRNLDLNTDQKAQIHALVLKNLQDRKQLQMQIQPQVQSENRETLKAIDAVLKPEQVQRFHDNLLEFKMRLGRNPLNPGPEGQSAPASAP